MRSKLPLLPSGPGGVRRSTFHGPWREKLWRAPRPTASINGDNCLGAIGIANSIASRRSGAYPAWVDPHAIKVVLRAPDGRYLASLGPEWVFTADLTRAQVFDFVRDEVAARVESARRDLGVTWTVVRADPRAGYETCDYCGRRVMAFKAAFDGRRFLCAECQNQPDR